MPAPNQALPGSLSPKSLWLQHQGVTPPHPKLLCAVLGAKEKDTAGVFLLHWCFLCVYGFADADGLQEERRVAVTHGVTPMATPTCSAGVFGEYPESYNTFVTSKSFVTHQNRPFHPQTKHPLNPPQPQQDLSGCDHCCWCSRLSLSQETNFCIFAA